MARYYYRVHWSDCPEFCAANAQSLPWGERDGVVCGRCDGAGYVTRRDGSEAECSGCGGAGFVAPEPEPGYSCCQSAEDLVRYFRGRIEPDDDEPVVIFAGDIVGVGPDGEPLVIPAALPRPRWTTYGAVRRAVERRAQRGPGHRPRV